MFILFVFSVNSDNVITSAISKLLNQIEKSGNQHARIVYTY